MASSKTIEHELEGLLHGRASLTGHPHIVLRDPGTGSAKRGRRTSTKPVVGDSICYVVAAVVFNEQGQVLLTREGFHPCYGKWYLPAGRVDPMETLEEAAVREVREETGLELQATSLMVVENPSPDWYRFTFTGKITGGKLRTQNDADSETLEAGWWDVDTVKNAKRTGRGSTEDPMKTFQLRGGDIVRLIELVKQHLQLATSEPTHSITPVLPNIVPLKNMLIRSIMLHKDSDGYSVLCYEESDKVRLPVMDIGVQNHHTKSALLYLLDMLGFPKGGVAVHGLLAVEHDGRQEQEDGLCLSVLLTVPENPTPRDSKFKWCRVSKEDLVTLCDTRRSPGTTISLLGI